MYSCLPRMMSCDDVILLFFFFSKTTEKLQLV